ncbi:MAG TPA: DNA repair protein RecO [Candidatus Polarisedimenticolaceae bacterium]|nr:DNA repair protein RecO [Candidatus Polarisedimenticolaceae bacterium]
MRQRRDEAYVLGTSALGEADLIVTLLAENQGRVRGVASSARKSRRRFGGALEPMTRVAAQWVEREGIDLHRIEALEPLRSYAAMQADPALQAACAVLAEITGAIVREEQADPTTFRLLGSVLDALEGGLDPWTAVRYTEYWLLKLHGVLPDLEHCASCGEPFDERDLRTAVPGSGLVCRRCPKDEGGIALTAADRSALQGFDRTAPGALGFEVRPGGALDALLRGALQAFAERGFKTYRHLRALRSVGP